MPINILENVLERFSLPSATVDPKLPEPIEPNVPAISQQPFLIGGTIREHCQSLRAGDGFDFPKVPRDSDLSLEDKLKLNGRILLQGIERGLRSCDTILLGLPSDSFEFSSGVMKQISDGLHRLGIVSESFNEAQTSFANTMSSYNKFLSAKNEDERTRYAVEAGENFQTWRKTLSRFSEDTSTEEQVETK